MIDNLTTRSTLSPTQVTEFLESTGLTDRTSARSSAPGELGDPTSDVARDAIRNCAIQIDLGLSGVRFVRRHQIWISGLQSAVLQQVADDGFRLHALATYEVGDLVCRMTGIGPRPELEPVVVECSAAADLSAPSGADRQGAAEKVARSLPEAWSGWREALVSGHWRVWTIAVRTSAGTTERAYVDTPRGVCELILATPPRLRATGPRRQWSDLLIALAGGRP